MLQLQLCEMRLMFKYVLFLKIQCISEWFFNVNSDEIIGVFFENFSSFCCVVFKIRWWSTFCISLPYMFSWGALWYGDNFMTHIYTQPLLWQVEICFILSINDALCCILMYLMACSVLFRGCWLFLCVWTLRDIWNIELFLRIWCFTL